MPGGPAQNKERNMESPGMEKRISLWNYIRAYVPLALCGVLLMAGEVTMDLLQPRLMSRIVDEGVLGIGSGGTGNLMLIFRLGLGMILIVLFGAVCGSGNCACVNTAFQQAGNSIRKDCYARILSFSFPQVDAYTTGSLVTRVTNDIVQVQNALVMSCRGCVRNILQALGSLYFIFSISPRFGWFALAAFPFMVGVMLFCLLKANPLFPVLQAHLDQINSILQEDISGIRIIKACVREAYEAARFGKANRELVRTQLKTLVIFAYMNPAINGIMYFVITLILLSGRKEIQIGTATPGTIMAAVTYTTSMLHGIMMMLMVSQSVSRGAASWGRVREILSTDPGLKDGTVSIVPSGAASVVFEDVSFCYPGARSNVLEHINLTIRPGETIGIMGATGCGKTTLVSLIPRFYDVTSGRVLVDGTDVRDWSLTSLRDRVRIALQKPELFSQSVFKNISWGKDGSTPDEIRSAAETAQADSFIRSLENGYDSVIAERGMSLSGGQKQRISIARAVLGAAGLLIFDDATSALDLKTEADLYAALNQSVPGCTRIIVAQRIASVRRADRILILENGTISACGSHEELLKTSQIYRDIYQSQLGEEEALLHA